MNNIVFLIDTLEIGGAENSLLSVYKNLKPKFDVSIIVFKSSNKKSKLNLSEIKAKRIFSLKSIFSLTNIFLEKKRSIILCFAPEIAAVANIINLFIFKKHKIVLSFRNSFLYYSTFNKFYVYLLFLVACLPSDAFHFLTESNKNSYSRIPFFENILNKKKFTIIPNYLRNWNFNFSNRIINKNKFQIIFIGRLCNQKRPFEFIKFCDLLNKYLPNIFTYHIFGDGPLKDKLLKSISSKDNSNDFTVYGKINNIESKLYNPFALIITSFYEGHPGIVGEAISSGIPVFSYPYDSFIINLLNKFSNSMVSEECSPKSLFNIFTIKYKNLLSRDRCNLEDFIIMEKMFDKFEITRLWCSFFNSLDDA